MSHQDADEIEILKCKLWAAEERAEEEREQRRTAEQRLAEEKEQSENTSLPKFLDIGPYLTNKQQLLVWHLILL